MRRRLARVLVGLLCAAALLPACAHAQTTAQSQQALNTLAGPLFQQLAALKGMANPGPVPPVLLRSREENRRYIEQELTRRYSPARLEAERKGMVAWGLIPPDYDLKRLFLDLVQEQVSAYYDPPTKTMVVGDWLPLEQQQAALMHELVHALQDRQVPLDTFIQPEPGKGDQLLARQALVEGEAVALQLTLLLQAQGTDFAALPDLAPLRGAITASTVGPAVQSAPKFIRDLLLFPYVEGLTFVHQFRKRQPWSAITDLYRDPPRSSAQILWPEKRLATREDPIPIALPDLGTWLPPDKVAQEDELGQFGLAQVAGLHLGETEGRRVTFGWRGDRYRIWEDEPGRFVLAYLVAMQAEPMANFLAFQLTSIVEKRHPALTRKGVPGKAGAIVTWQEGGRAWVVEKRGAEVLLLERVPAAVADQLREAIWQSRGNPRP